MKTDIVSVISARLEKVQKTKAQLEECVRDCNSRLEEIREHISNLTDLLLIARENDGISEG